MNFNFNFILIQVREYPQVQELLNICKKDGLLNEVDGKLLPVETSNKCKDESIPFVVIEGLDGAGQSFVTIFFKANSLNVSTNSIDVLGKTSIADKVQKRYHMCPMQTPPPGSISDFREFFDNQSEPVRRAFYSLGNYFAANNVIKCTKSVIMDR